MKPATMLGCAVFALLGGAVAGVTRTPHETRTDNGYVYGSFSGQLNWEDAEQSCINDFDGHLISVHSAAENDILDQLTANLPNLGHPEYQRAWMGSKHQTGQPLSDAIWADGSPLEYIPPGEPCDDSLNHECGMYLHNNNNQLHFERCWGDWECTGLLSGSLRYFDGWVCKRPTPPCPTRVAVAGVPATPVPITGDAVSGNGMDLVELHPLLHPAMVPSDAYMLGTVAPGESIGLHCCGDQACDFFVTFYSCPTCSGSKGGGKLAAKMLSAGWAPGLRCSPKLLLGGDRYRMLTLHRRLPGNTEMPLPLVVDSAVEHIAVITVDQTSALPDPWCPGKGPNPQPPGGPHCAAMCL